MSTPANVVSQSGPLDDKLEAIRSDLNALNASPRRQAHQRLLALLPDIEATLLRGATQKQALEILEKHGVSVSLATFRRLLKDARDQKLRVTCSRRANPTPSNATGEAGVSTARSAVTNNDQAGTSHAGGPNHDE